MKNSLKVNPLNLIKRVGSFIVKGGLSEIIKKKKIC